MEVVPLMPDEDGLPDEFRDLRDRRRKLFAWNYVFNGADGAAAARAAGYSDHLEAAKVRAHHLLQRGDVNDAIQALCTKFLFSLAPKALLRLGQLLDKPDHPKHAKAIEMTLDRAGHAVKTQVDVNVSGSVTVNHTDAALESLRQLQALGVSHEKLIETFGHSGLERYERMLLEADRREGRVIEGEVVRDDR